MPRLNWALICQQVVTAQETNLVSYLNAIEQISTQEFPAPFPRLTIASLWLRDGDDRIAQRITVKNENGEVINEPDPIETEFGEFSRYRINQTIGGFEVSAPGDLTFVVECRQDDEWVEVWEFIVSIKQFDPEKETPVVEAT